MNAVGDMKRELDLLVTTELASSYRLASVILGDPSEAEDAIHDAVVLAIRNWQSLRDRDRAPAWFQRILINECRRRLRNRSVVRWHPTNVSVAAIDPVTSWAERDAMWEAVSRLDPEHRLVIVLVFYGDLSMEAVADRLGLRVGTVKSRLHYGLRSLRAEYDSINRTTAEALHGRV